MLTLGPISFAAPWALAAFLVLPVLWWLLRVTPPQPVRIAFPPVRLLFGLTSREETPAKSPPWLLILRMALVIAVILGAAHPLLNATASLRGDGPLVLVIDDGWAAARDWTGRREMLSGLIDRAERDERAVIIVTTAPAETSAFSPHTRMLGAGEARTVIEALQPKPWPTDRAAAQERLSGLAISQPGPVMWLSDGLEDGDTAAFVAALRRLGTVTVVADPPERLATALRPPIAEGDALNIGAVRAAAGGATRRWVRALGEDGRLLAREALHFADGERQAETSLTLPTELRNRLARLEIENENTAGAVVLMDERWRRRPVGLVTGEGTIADQPLLSDLYYLDRALEPFTEVRRGTVAELLRRELAVLVLVDPGRLDNVSRRTLERWIEVGGVAVRFAGPRLAQDSQALLPVRLRAGDRVMGGTMSWDKPATLAAFHEGSPFYGLAIPADVTIQRQVLARPALDLGDRTWARLSDGTPLVTAEKRGKGWLVLVHTTGNTSWSNLPLSGLFVEMLRRLVGLSQGVVATEGAAPLPPLDVLDGFGRLRPAPASALAIAGSAFESTAAAPEHPPGYYGDKTARRALNLTANLSDVRSLAPALSALSGVSRAAYGRASEVDLRAWSLGAALLLAVVDLAVSLVLRGLLRLGAAAGMVVAVLAAPGTARAQAADDFAPPASLTTRLGYVLTGDAQVDETAGAGLRGLSVIVRRRTAAELGEPVGVDPETDELVFFPLLYWPITPGQPPLSAQAAAKVNAYLRNGGTILFDTHERAGGAEVDVSRRSDVLNRLVRQLDIPPLVPVAPDHVLTRSFYLMRAFPGRWAGGTVWVERTGERINDGVSPVIVGGHDWAAAWAMDEAQRPLFAVVPGGERQREMAYRFGINLVMYTLTGNYKSDQVHLPAILKRLTQ